MRSILGLSVFSFGIASVKDTITIAPGVDMPMVTLGVSNHTLWIEIGGRGLDTAFNYGDANQAETGLAVRNSGLPRSDFFVTTKVSCCPTSFKDNYLAGCDKVGRNTSQDLQHDMDVLGLDYVDLLLLHQPCDQLEDAVAEYKLLEQYVASGKARAIGVSNFNATMLEAFVSMVSIKPAVNQNGYSIGGHSKELSPWGRDDVTLAKAKELGITHMAYSPLGGYTQLDVLKDPTVLAVAAAHNKTAAQIALRWNLEQGIPVVTSTNKRSHQMSDLDIFDFKLTDSEMKSLSAVKPESATLQI